MMKLTLLLAAIILISTTVIANDNTLKSSNIVKKTDQNKLKKKKQTKKKSKFSFSTRYSFSSDYYDERSPRLYNHNLSLSASGKIAKKIGIGVDGGFYFKTIDGSVYQNRTEDSGYHLNDTTLSASFGHKLKEISKQVVGIHSLGVSISNTFPTSDESRLEGYQSILRSSFTLNSSFLKGFYSLINSLSSGYYFNEYTHSPATGNSTPSHYVRYGQSHNFKLHKYLKLSVSFGFKKLFYSDNFSNISFGNSASISSGYGPASFGLKFSGGGHSHNDNMRLWYIDKTRRVVSMYISIGV